MYQLNESEKMEKVGLDSPLLLLSLLLLFVFLQDFRVLILVSRVNWTKNLSGFHMNNARPSLVNLSLRGTLEAKSGTIG
jgi:hypothetical protein